MCNTYKVYNTDNSTYTVQLISQNTFIQKSLNKKIYDLMIQNTTEIKTSIVSPINLKEYFIYITNGEDILTENLNFKVPKNQPIFLDKDINTINISIFNKNNTQLKWNRDYILVVKFLLEQYE